jgi:Family of unknown function (DUF5947)
MKSAGIGLEFVASGGKTSPDTSNSQAEAFSALRRFAQARAPVERCELCGLELASEHGHLLEPGRRRIVCACDACSILFCGQEKAKFLRVPRRVVRLDNFAFTDLEWGAMMLPINLAFFLRGADGGTTAMYPSPAGAMESLICLAPWTDLFGRTETVLSRVEIEVEALMVNRISDDASYFIVPIDACYQLVGLIRTKWRGLSGGSEVWQAIAEFFAVLDRRATHASGAARA